MANKKVLPDLNEALQQAGFKIGHESDEFVRVNAFFRGSEDFNLAINKNTGTVSDFPRGVTYSLDTLFKYAKGEDLTEEEKKAISNLKENFSKEERFVPPEKIYDASILETLFPTYTYWLERGISEPVLKFTKSGLCHESPFYRYYVFPIFNSKGQIHGWSGRDVTGKQKVKWKHEGRSGSFIYGVYMRDDNGNMPVRDAIMKENRVNIVESIGDCLSLWEVGVWNTIPSFGLNISPKLTAFLAVIGHKVNICFNSDENNAGNFAALKNYCKLSPYVQVRLKLTPSGKDLNDILAKDRRGLLWWNQAPSWTDDRLKKLFEEKKNSKGGLTKKEEEVYKRL